MNFGKNIRKLASQFNWAVRTIHLKEIKEVDLKFYLSASNKFSTEDVNKNYQRQLFNDNSNWFNRKSENTLGHQLGFAICNDISVPSIPLQKKIIEPDFGRKQNVEIPFSIILNNTLELPCDIQQEKVEPIEKTISKRLKSIHMIRIRKRKMKKHKLKKFLKRTKIQREKREIMMNLRKEQALQAKIKDILKEGEAFSGEKYLEAKLTKLDWTPPITHARGRLAPKWVIKQEQERKAYDKILRERIDECISKLKL